MNSTKTFNFEKALDVVMIALFIIGIGVAAYQGYLYYACKASFEELWMYNDAASGAVFSIGYFVHKFAFKEK